MIFRFTQEQRRHRTCAFTLIELLIVVAIIAILAAIAVPNFLEAQIRSKVSRAKADMRTMATAIEQYAVDCNSYPDHFSHGLSLTTPVAYISSVPRDPFMAAHRHGGPGGPPPGFGELRYSGMPIDHASRWIVGCVGPDTDIDTYANDVADNWDESFEAFMFYPGYSDALFSEDGAVVNATKFKYVMYDSTNGTVSNGDLFRVSDHNP